MKPLRCRYASTCEARGPVKCRRCKEIQALINREHPQPRPLGTVPDFILENLSSDPPAPETFLQRLRGIPFSDAVLVIARGAWGMSYQEIADSLKELSRLATKGKVSHALRRLRRRNNVKTD